MPQLLGRPPIALGPEAIRKPVLPFRVGLTIEGYTLINYRIPLARLAPHLPEDLTPITTEVAGVPCAWFSLFVGTNVIRRLGNWPIWPLVVNQLNYRTYIRLEGGHGVYILRSVVGLPAVPALLGGPLSLGARFLLDFPLQWEPFRLERRFEGDRLVRIDAQIGGARPELTLEVRNTGTLPVTPGFRTPEEAVRFLGDLPEAYLPLAPHHYRQLLAFHPPLSPEGGTVVTGHGRWLSEAGLLDDQALLQPESVFLQGCAAFPTYV